METLTRLTLAITSSGRLTLLCWALYGIALSIVASPWALPIWLAAWSALTSLIPTKCWKTNNKQVRKNSCLFSGFLIWELQRISKSFSNHRMVSLTLQFVFFFFLYIHSAGHNLLPLSTWMLCADYMSFFFFFKFSKFKISLPSLDSAWKCVKMSKNKLGVSHVILEIAT